MFLFTSSASVGAAPCHGITLAPELPISPILVMYQTHWSEEAVCTLGICHRLQVLVTRVHTQHLKSYNERVFCKMVKEPILERFPQKLPLRDKNQQLRMQNAWGLHQRLGLSWRFPSRT